MDKVCVVIPAYNEAQSLGFVLDELCNYEYVIIVVDDGSIDGTNQIVQKYPVHLLRHAINLGQGAALQTGIDYALQLHDLDYLVTFDADGQHTVSNIPKLVEAIKNNNCDVVLGSRFCMGGSAQNIKKTRKITLLMGLLFTKLSTGLNITDTHNGLRCFTISAVKKINITQNRMAHASELLSIIAKSRLSYCEVPVDIIYTQYSLSKGQKLIDGVDILFDIFKGRF